MKIDLSEYQDRVEEYSHSLQRISSVIICEEVQKAIGSLERAEELLEKRHASKKDELEILDLIGEAEEVLDIFSQVRAQVK